MRRAGGLLALLLALPGCFKAWEVGGPWACGPDDGGARCPAGLTCDDGVCCDPQGAPSCPTLPSANGCPPGSRPQRLYRDADTDGAGDPTTGRDFCRAPVKERWVPDGGDCDDGDATIGPTATERCNAVDDNCRDGVDEGLPRTAFARDVDGDGFGEACASCLLEACTQPQGYAARAGDCAPDDPAVFPGAPERCDDVDNNCNGQRDDPPFIDVENPDQPGGATFDCPVPGARGPCSQGGLQCVYSLSQQRFAPQCVPRVARAVDACGNGQDEDCSGTPDDAPGCGGPRALLAEPGLTFSAVTVPATEAGGVVQVPGRCLAHEPGAAPMGWLNPAWIGTTSALHVWAAEAPAGTWWDLSTAGRLVLPFEVTHLATAAEGFWGDGARFANVVVTLCGDRDTSYRRFTPTAAATRVTGAATAATVTVPLAGATTGWSVTSAGGFSLATVRRVEVMLSPPPDANDWVTFTLRFSPDAGFVGP